VPSFGVFVLTHIISFGIGANDLVLLNCLTIQDAVLQLTLTILAIYPRWWNADSSVGLWF